LEKKAQSLTRLFRGIHEGVASMRYKAIFSDVDGTLLNSEHKISPVTRQKIQQLSETRHVPFILVSARMPQAILPLQQELGIHAPIVAYGGALVLSEPDLSGKRETLRNLYMDPSTVSSIYDVVSGRYPSISCSMYNKDDWYVLSFTDPWVVQEKEITAIQPILMDADFTSSSERHINKIMCMGEPEIIDRLSKDLTVRFPELTIFKSKPTYLEIMAAGVTKSAAIQTLERVLGLGRNEIMAIGDNFNDMDMLRYAGLGVAMGNAPEEVKACSDEITDTNDEDGIVRILEKHFGAEEFS
jgi:Cof subfamily protein (haloacid dehalogenase superfamily)